MADVPLKLAGAARGECPEGQLASDRGCVVPPEITDRVEAKYPREARKRGIEGTVVVEATVEVDGTVGEVKVVHTTKPGVGFEEAVVTAVRQWRYKPGRIGDEPVRVTMAVSTEFTTR
jgi:protein TonB